MTTAARQRRDDGTCWTCAKPRCLGWFGHMLGRLRYAARCARHGKPRSLVGRLRLTWHDFITHGLLNRGGERCQDCGRHYLLWFAPDDLWQRLVDDSGAGLLCLRCFSDRAEAVGLTLEWHPANRRSKWRPKVPETVHDPLPGSAATVEIPVTWNDADREAGVDWWIANATFWHDQAHEAWGRRDHIADLQTRIDRTVQYLVTLLDGPLDATTARVAQAAIEGLTTPARGATRE